MCSSFHNASSELYTAMALVGKRIYTSYVGFRAFVGGCTEANHTWDKPALMHKRGTLTSNSKGVKFFAIYGVPVLWAYVKRMHLHTCVQCKSYGCANGRSTLTFLKRYRTCRHYLPV